MTPRPVFASLGALVAAALTVTGCVSLPTGGPVLSYPVTQGTGAQNQPYVQIVPRPPGVNWSPTQIVQGFLTASASFGNHSEVAKQYLTPQYRETWNPSWSAIVYKTGPDIRGSAVPSALAKNVVTVQVTGKEQAQLQGNGSYSVPSAATPAVSPDADQTFELVKAGSQWRIASAPQELLLTSDSFANDYELRNLYFLDPASRYLVPDPVYVPLQDKPGDLMNGLVGDLINPPEDWLSSGATKTALPRDTKIGSVTLDGVTAFVNLTGSAISKAGTATMRQLSAQLLWTLSGTAQSGQTVQSVEVEVNGKPWSPPGSQGNPVQRQSTTNPAGTKGGSLFYYVDSAGYLNSRNGAQGKPARGALIGTGYSQVAVSQDGQYLAALRGSTLYAGLVGGALAKKGTGYQTMSWDVDDDLWASTGTQIVMFRGSSDSRQPLGPAADVNVVDHYGVSQTGPFTTLRVAPDGVRVALVIASTFLTFGAISGQQGASPRISLSQVQSTPLNASMFTGLTWYGPDNVITLAIPGPVATEYPVSGGTPVSVSADPGMQSITASAGNLLVAGLPHGQLAANASLTGSWAPLGAGSDPVYPG
jgi:hypothetical protein